MSGHGYSRYTHGCRCEVCREAKRLYEKQRRAERLATGDIHHGTRHGYDSGCRCVDCRIARIHAYYRNPGEYKAKGERRPSPFVREGAL